tara:strand:+ start:336 stop:509 length:174 start_codon:yes stop_codon:yes gene_type:complete
VNSISSYFPVISSMKLDCNRGFVQIPAGKLSVSDFLALVAATKNNLLSSSICAKLSH